MKRFKKIFGLILLLFTFTMISNVKTYAAVDQTKVKELSNAIIDTIKSNGNQVKVMGLNIDPSEYADILDATCADVQSYVDAGRIYFPVTPAVWMGKVYYINLYYYTDDKSKVVTKAEAIEKKVDYIINNYASKGKTDFEKAQIVHDYLATNCQYANDHYKNNTTTPDDSTSYGCLINGSAVCEGYARAYELIMNRMGIETKRVEGDDMPGGGSHEWNVIKLGGKWYYVDVCWDDPVWYGLSSESYKDYVQYTDFLKTTSEFEKDHGNSKNWYVDAYSGQYIPNYRKATAGLPVANTESAYKVNRDLYKITVPVTSPTISKAAVSKDNVTLTWNATTKIGGYVIYRSTNATSGYQQIAKVTDPATVTYKDTLTKNGTYYYKVRAYYTGYSANYYSAYSAAKSADITAISTAIKVDVGTPTLSATSTNENVKLTWSSVVGANGYEVYKDGKLVKTTTATSFSESLSATGTHTYKVRAYKVVSGKNYYSGYSEKSVTITIALTKPVISGITVNQKIATIAWNSVTGASGYEVYRNGSKIASVTATSYKDQLSDNGTYSYTVKAYKNFAGKTYNSAVSTAKTVTVNYVADNNKPNTPATQPTTTPAANITVDAPKSMVVSAINEKVTMSWSAVSGATGYKIYRKIGNGSYSQIQKLGQTTCYDNVTANGSYTYKVVAYKTVSGKEYTSTGIERTTNVTIIGTPASMTASANLEKVSLKWVAVTGAEGYQIFRNGTLIKTVTATSYAESLKTSGTYTYKIRAYRGSYYSGYATKAVKVTVVTVAKPTLSSVSASNKTVTVKWTKVAGANGYEIYRSTKASSGYTKVATITNGNTVSWKNTISAGGAYYYKVRAFKKVSGRTFYSAYSEAKSVRVTPATSLTSVKASGAKVTLKWSKVTGAKGYQIYRSTKSGSGYACVKKVTSGNTVSFVNTVARKKTYYYKVRAYYVIGGKIYYSSFSTVKSIKVN